MRRPKCIFERKSHLLRHIDQHLATLQKKGRTNGGASSIAGARRSVATLSTLRKGPDEDELMWGALARLHVAGLPLNWARASAPGWDGTFVRPPPTAFTGASTRLLFGFCVSSFFMSTHVHTSTRSHSPTLSLMHDRQHDTGERRWIFDEATTAARLHLLDEAGGASKVR